MRANSYGVNDLGNTYIEVDLTEQYMWYYQDGNVIFESDIVSGLASDPKRKTPPGIDVYKRQVYEAKTPVMDGLMKDYPFVKGNASGLAVGLPDGQMGNSEVGHMNMGAGRIVYQELTRITKEIQDGDFFKNEACLLYTSRCV